MASYVRRLADLASRFELTADAVAQLGALVELMVSDRQAPTSIRDPTAVLDDHVADSLVALELETVRRARRVVDLGSGPGFPGLALAAALPGAVVTLVESSARKCAFLERAVRECGISNADVAHTRAESFVDGLSSYELATARALSSLEVTAEYAAPLLRVGGSLVAWRGGREAATEAKAQRAARELGLGPPEVHPVKPYEDAVQRHLYVFAKVAETRARFPRRPGMAAKRPLGHEPPSDRVRR